MPLRLNKYTQHTPVRIHRPSQPVFPATDRDDHLIQMPFVGYMGPVTSEAIGKMAAKPFRPLPDGLPADQNAPLGQKILVSDT